LDPEKIKTRMKAELEEEAEKKKQGGEGRPNEETK